MLLGFIAGSALPLVLGMLIAMPQGVKPETFLWAITHFEWYYNSIFQLGVTLLNVNMPVPEVGEIRGIKICRQAQAKWKESFDQRKDPFGRDYYWMTGNFINMDHGQDTDEWALKHGYVSVVPTMFDLTDHQRIAQLNQWGLDEFSV